MTKNVGHPRVTDGRYGFVAWNEFQVKHFSRLLGKVRKPAIFMVKDRASADFMRLAPLIESKYGAVAIKVNEGDIPVFDGLFDGIFSQTDFKSSKRMKKTPLYALQYSMTKESHQYGAWHIYFSAAFCYGRYSAERIGYACRTFACGHPRLDRSGGDVIPDLLARYRDELDPGKRTILYAPTWGVGGRVEDFLQEMDWLKDRFNIIIRPHHNAHSRELHRFGVVNIPECPVLEDDFATQATLADVVISDYSGVMFDSLYVGRPVILFRDESVAGERKSSYSPSSIEVARADDIGPLAHTGDDLRRLLDDGEFRFADEFKERNARLVDECFSDGSDVAGDIMGLVESWIGADRVEPLHQEWLRDFVKKKEALVRRSSGKATRPAKKKRAAPAPKPHVVFGAVRDKLRGMLMRHRNLYIQYLILMSKARSFGYRMNAADILSGIGEPRAAANLLRPTVKGEISDKFFHLWIKDPGNRINIDRARDFGKLFEVENLSFIAKMRRGVCLSDTGYAESVIQSAMLDMANGDMAQGIAAVDSLERLRCYDNIRTGLAESPGLLESAFVRSALSRIGGIEEGLGALVGHSGAAARSLGEGYANESSEISIYLPQHFFSINKKIAKRREKNWDLIRGTYLKMLRAIESDGSVRFSMRHQYFLNMVEVEEKKPVISFFTKGGGRGNWHLKDLGLSTFVSIDPDGFLGSSILGTLPVERIAAALEQMNPDQGIFDEVEAMFGLHGGDKYGNQREQPSWLESDEYVFVALQSTKGLEDTYQPIDGLIQTMAKFSRDTGRRVVFKRHPLCEDILVTNALRDAMRIPSVSMNGGDTWDLVKGCSAVVTVNSGVGLQAIVARKPLVITGPSETRVVALRAGSFQEIPSILSRVGASSVPIDEYARFLAFYFRIYLVDPCDRRQFMDRIRSVIDITRASASKDEVREKYLDYLSALAISANGSAGHVETHAMSDSDF